MATLPKVRRSALGLSLVAAMAAAAAFASVARADTPKFETNFYFNCMADHNIGVPVGSDLVLRFGWEAKTRGLVQDYLNGRTPIRVEIDGVPLDNPEQYWTEPFYVAAAGDWRATWRYDTGLVSSFDEVHSIDIETLATHRITDGETTADDGTSRPLFLEPGDAAATSFGPCSITPF